MSDRNNCATCRHSKLNDNPALHCYMFKTEPEGRCHQHTERRVGTIGHVGGGGLLAAALMVALAQSRRQVAPTPAASTMAAEGPARKVSEPNGQDNSSSEVSQ